MNVYKYSYEHNHIRFNSHIYKIGTYHYNWHPETEVLVLLTGRAEVCHEGVRTILEPGDVIVYSPQSGHATLALEENSIAMVCHIDLAYFSSFDKDFKRYKFCFFSDAESRNNPIYSGIRRCMAKLMRLQTISLDGLAKIQIEAIFAKLVSLLWMQIDPIKEIPRTGEVARETEATFIKIIQFIDKHYHEKIGLEEIAAIGGYNVDYVSQFFKRQMGISFIDYVMRLRLREAAVLLTNTDYRIVQIAHDCGFTDVKSFNTAFKKKFSMTPSEYRKKAKALDMVTTLQDWKEFIGVENQVVSSILEVWSSIEDIPMVGDMGRSSKQAIDVSELETCLESLLRKVKEMAIKK